MTVQNNRPKQLCVSALTGGLIGYHWKVCVQLSPSSFTGEVFLYNSRNLSEPQHNESYSGECRRESAVQAALLPQDHGAQAKQGTLIRSPIQRRVGCCIDEDAVSDSTRSLNEHLFTANTAVLWVCALFVLFGDWNN